MGYTNIRATYKCWEQHTKNLEYCLFEVFDEHNNKFVKWWSPGSELILDTNISTLPTLKLTSQIMPSSKMIDLKFMLISHQDVLLLVSLHNTVNIITYHISTSQQTIAHGIMPYQKLTGLVFGSSLLSEKNQQQTNNFWYLYQVKNQQEKYNGVHIITVRRDKNTFITNIQ